MASFKSFLSGLGHVLAKVFSPGAVQLEATVADALLPGFAPLINSAATAIINAEAKATAAGFQTGSGPQKLAFATAEFANDYASWCKANNIPVLAGNAANFVNGVVALLNGLPAAEGEAPLGATAGGATTTAPAPAAPTAPLAPGQ